MQFLRTLLWIVIAVLVALFCYNNWTPVTLRLWSGLQLDSKLPVLLFAAFLIGFLPMLLLHRTSRWRMRRRLESVERTLADIRGVTVDEPAPPVVVQSIPPGSIPTAVPPGVS